MAEPILVNPGQSVGVAEWDQLMRQHGGNNTPGRQIPLTDPKIKALITADPSLVTHLQQHPVYRYYMADGTSVDAFGLENGEDVQIVSYTPSTKFQQTQTAAGQKGELIQSDEQDDGQGNVTKTDTYRRSDGTTYQVTSTVKKAPGQPKVGRTQVQIGGKNLIKVTSVDPATNKSDEWYEDPANPGVRVQPPTEPTTKTNRVQVTVNGKNLIKVTTADSATGKGEEYYEDPATGQRVQPPVQPPGQPFKDQNGRWWQMVYDAEGTPSIKAVTQSTIIKPADLPVLQAKYGEIASSLGKLAAELNQKVAAGEITPEERDRAFGAAHQQAQVQVEEINSILSNSQAAWSGQVTQRGQTFSEAASRRSYAGNVMSNALTVGGNIASGALPGHGKAIAAGVGALMDIGKNYAAGMGGFPDMSEVPLPRALQQAQQVGIPGLPDPTGGGLRPGAPGAGPGLSRPPQTAGGGAFDVIPQPLPWRGQNPGMSTMPNRGPAPGMTLMGMGANMGGGMPGALGMSGSPQQRITLPDTELQSMLGDGSDPDWEDAVRRAHAGMM